MIDVATFYLFSDLSDIQKLREKWLARGPELGLRGTILLAEEGINGTLCGSRGALETFLDEVRQVPALKALKEKYSTADPGNLVFHRFKIKLKREIVTFGIDGIRPAEHTGEHVSPARWNELLEDPEVLVIDTRNSYEYAIGTFPGAVDPETTTFREFPDYVRAHLDPSRTPRVAMFCTGGIRCEKATAFMLDEGFEAVYQLDGGILKYLEEVDPEENRWQGECFVFDQRVSVDADLREGQFEQCFACRRALSAEDLASKHYVAGVSCPHCIDERDAASRSGFEERRRQVLLAQARGEGHVGVPQKQHTSSGSGGG